MGKYYNRYVNINSDDTITSPPFVLLDNKITDKMVIYDVRKSRLDKISQEYYGVPYYGWLILMANPQFRGLEWNIPDGQPIRVPYPLEQTINEYEIKLNNRIRYYG